MIDQKAFFAIFLYGLTAMFLERLPFRWRSINLAISWFFAVIFLSLWSLRRSHWNLFSFKFALHILMSCLLLLALIYLFHEKKNKL